MKNRSIRFKITLWYAAALIIIAGLTFVVIRFSADMVLRNTIRDYLISVVEANSDEILYAERKPTQEDPSHVYIRLSEGYLVIDEDFMNTVSDVNTAIYKEDGEMLYGENPLAKETENISFTGSQLWSLKQGNDRYNLYDRKLNLDTVNNETLWLRGIVSEEMNVKELDKITRTFFIIMPFLIVLALMLGYFISGKMLSPIRKLEQAASRISGGNDLKQRIEIGNNKDELSKLAEDFNEMFERLDHSFEAEQQFTSDASHELRTPMSVILAQTEYTLEKDRSPEEYKEALQVIKRQGDRMNTLINDMLDYTRMDQSSERYPLTKENLSEITEETAEQMSLLPDKNITLDREVHPDIFVNGNKMLLTRLLQNLISNAYRYGKQNGHIHVRLKQEDGQAVLTVEDDGIGIAPEEQEKIFERFYRSDASRSIKGTGLGLSMVKKIVELHDARIVLESEPGIGSTFKFFLKLFEH